MTDGRVVVIPEGYPEDDRRTEIYDPAANNWTTGRPSPIVNFGMVASPLPSGLVLVAGGANAGSAKWSTDAALYDPEHDIWTMTASLRAPTPEQGVATPLPAGPTSLCGTNCGKVLLVTGVPGSQTFAPELYDPAATDPATGRPGAWTYTALVQPNREEPTVTVLPTGQVLVVGGREWGASTVSILSSAELYDPRLGRSALTAALPTPRWMHSATLIPGGCDARQIGAVLVAGGYDNDRLEPGPAYTTAVVYPLHLPKVTGVSAAGGLTGAGTPVTITGVDLGGATQVTFGGVLAAFTVVSDTRIDAVSPRHAPGPADVVVTTPNGVSPACPADQFSYGGQGSGPPQPPQVTLLSPSYGPPAGGTTVTITGRYFLRYGRATAVSFGGTAATQFAVLTDTQMVAYSPPHGAGAVDVTVTTPAGTSAISRPRDLFTYQPPGPLQEQQPPALIRGGLGLGPVEPLPPVPPVGPGTVLGHATVTAPGPAQAPGAVQAPGPVAGSTAQGIGVVTGAAPPAPVGVGHLLNPALGVRDAQVEAAAEHSMVRARGDTATGAGVVLGATGVGLALCFAAAGAGRRRRPAIAYSRSR